MTAGPRPGVDLVLRETEQHAAETHEQALLGMLGEMGRVVVAFSGGVDSSYLLACAMASAAERVVAVIGVSPSLAASELEAARALASSLGTELREVRTEEMENPAYVRNAGDRCFHCKNELFSKIASATEDIGSRAIVDGTNATDAADERPGMRAALQHGVRSPLRDARLEKREIRYLAKIRGLDVWEKPEAACLASRLNPGIAVTRGLLARVEAAEAVLKELGFVQVRVRTDGRTARIETDPEELPSIVSHRLAIVARLGSLGYDYVTVDLAGYRKGGRALTHGEN
jgi:uncharacterized protein